MAGPLSARAQDRQIGLKAGASVATLQREHTQVGDDPFGTRTGLTIGGFALLPVRNRVALQLEALFTEKGASLPLRDPDIIQGSLSTRYDFQYLDLPVLVRVRGPRIRTATLHAFAGPSLGVRLSAKEQLVFETPAAAGFQRDLGDEMKFFDVGFAVGSGVEIGRAVIDARYTWGFGDVLSDAAGTALSNRGFLITAGVRLFQGF